MKLIKFQKVNVNEGMDTSHVFVFGVKLYENKIDSFYFVFNSPKIREGRCFVPNKWEPNICEGFSRFSIVFRNFKFYTHKVFYPLESKSQYETLIMR